MKRVMKKLSWMSGIFLSFVFFFYLSPAQSKNNQADMVVFSFDRPLQLYALLESLEKYVSHVNETHVIYRVSDATYDQAYNIVFKSFPKVLIHKQGDQSAKDFKPLTLKAAFDSPSSYVIFAVDDIIVKDYVDMSECIKHLEKQNAYRFFLRLGTNLRECYTMYRAQPLPPFKKLENDVYTWQFAQGRDDWGYPHTVDMTVYKKKSIEEHLRVMSYPNPNRLEGVWHGQAHSKMNAWGLCFKQSKIVNLPLNKVQTVFNNRAMNFVSVKELLSLFNAGKKMDIKPLEKVNNKAAHMEYTPTYIIR